MKRRWNWPIWVGFVVIILGLFSYEFFARFPITRDFPWANFLLFGIGIALLLVGCSAPSVGRKFTAERFSARSSQRLLRLLSRFSATNFCTSFGRCRLQLAHRTLAKRHLTFFCWIKMEDLSVSVICCPTPEVSC